MSVKFVIYDQATGQIVRRCTAPEHAVNAQAHAGEAVYRLGGEELKTMRGSKQKDWIVQDGLLKRV